MTFEIDLIYDVTDIDMSVEGMTTHYGEICIFNERNQKILDRIGCVNKETTVVKSYPHSKQDIKKTFQVIHGKIGVTLAFILTQKYLKYHLGS